MDKSFKTLIFSSVILTIAGCSNVDNHYMPPAHSGLTGFTANNEDISHHLHIATNRLNILKLQGGVSCVPASVWTINKTLKLADKNLRANLLVDAANAVVLAQSQLHHAQQRVNYLTERTDCNDTITASLIEKRNQTVAIQSQTKHQQKVHQHTLNIIELLLNGNNQFASNKAELTVSYISHLELAAPMIKQFKDITIMLTGHTDAVGSERSNQVLSQKRVEMVKNKLLELGIKESQIKILASGETMPLATNQTPTGRLANRRVSATVIFSNSASINDETTDNTADMGISTDTQIEKTKIITTQQPLALYDWWQVLDKPEQSQITNATEYPHSGR